MSEGTSSSLPHSPRRAVRKRNKPKKYGDFLETSPTKRKVDNSSESSDTEDFNEEEFELQKPQKPTALFSSDDVEGQDMFKFKSRRSRLDLQNKVKSAIANSPNAARSPVKTPRKSFHRGSFASPFKLNEATPKHVKDILKKKIMKKIEGDSEESDFSGSSSDFVPEDSDNETASSQSNASEEEEEVKKPSKMQATKSKDVRAKQKDSEYFVTPDNYFMMHSSKKITTSDHTLARLKNMNLGETVNENCHVSEEHKSKIAELNKSYDNLFDKWLFIMSENFNLVLYGVGSKRSVIQRFVAEKLQDFPCIVVNGFFPSLTLKSILETIIIDLLENSSVPANVGDIVSLIDTQLKDNGTDVFLIVHNIDGVMLRSAKSQAMLASIAQIDNVHLICSIDHINAPLLWDHSKLSKFNFTWWDVTTFQPYTVETSFENSLMSQRSGALQLSSLRTVFQSLTTNAKGIFNIIIKFQLENQKQPHYQGLPFKDLYSKSREQFLVSSDLALRAQLTEFLDHKLVKLKRTYDGSENLLIPIDNGLLQQFLEEQDA